MLSREERIHYAEELGFLICENEMDYGLIRMKKDGEIYYWVPLKEKDADIYWTIVKQPKGYYCFNCAITQWESDYPMAYPDGEPCLFWNQCKVCKLRSKRSYAAKKWTDAIKEIDPEFNHTRLATFTMPDITWAIKDVGFNWDFFEEESFLEWIHENCRPFEKDGKQYYKFLGEPSEIMKQTSDAMRKKLKQRIKDMRHKNNNFKKKVKGGIVCYEATINVDIVNKTINLHPHLHAILHGEYYQQDQLQDDWGLGIVDIRKIENQWIAQLEVAKYVGKDGSRRTSWGSIRKSRSDIIASKKLATSSTNAKTTS